MSQQFATLQQTLMDQNQQQMTMMQQQFQKTLETSLCTISETIAQTLAKNQAGLNQYPSEICCTIHD